MVFFFLLYFPLMNYNQSFSINKVNKGKIINYVYLNCHLSICKKGNGCFMSNVICSPKNLMIDLNIFCIEISKK